MTKVQRRATLGAWLTMRYGGRVVSGRPYLASVELLGINDPTARLNALLAGQVQAIEYVDASQIRVLKSSSTVTPLISPGGAWTPIYMNTKDVPFNDVRVRQAMRLLRYGSWLGGIIRGDLGKSAINGVPVTQLIGQRLLNSLLHWARFGQRRCLT